MLKFEMETGQRPEEIWLGPQELLSLGYESHRWLSVPQSTLEWRVVGKDFLHLHVFGLPVRVMGEQGLRVGRGVGL